ncbi:hypothetical protein J2S53_003627 [Actinopolyspora lacussalsi]|uniref:SMI1/KNR4 family protein n=1 Tax=Actinopolyspora righensis TaxID=995060 RepID=A0A1I6XX43_9ACTN|nr:hypothetical protein [Actinopolyspora righensis]MDP9643682.1 hypothetical protein [Actinopolyspora lacussalsi]SFT42979.1 hypothetical protein SAMN04487904_10232 [Actinopolyspora righensis]
MTVDVANTAITLLRRVGVTLHDGLHQDELRAVQRRFGFEFSPDHAALLASAVPVGDGWPDWRHDTCEELSTRLTWPVEGAVLDVLHDDFWPVSWGPRPVDDRLAERRAREHLERWPKLIPLYSHRYMPAAPACGGDPVLSVHRTDVIHYGVDLVDYLHREFHRSATPHEHTRSHRWVAHWSDLASGAENDEL